MKRKQIYIAAGQERELQRLADERGDSEALVIREAMTEYFAALGSMSPGASADLAQFDETEDIRRKQVYIDEGQDEAVRAYAYERGVTQSLVFREAVAQYISHAPGRRPVKPDESPLLTVAGFVGEREAPMNDADIPADSVYGTPKGKHIRMEDTPLWALVGLVSDVDAPTDSAINHDHYIYGVPKKYE